MIEEGVTRFVADHTEAPLRDRTEKWRALSAWRSVLAQLGLIGADRLRYGGIGFGNLSARLEGRAFVITGTQTGSIPRLEAKHFARVAAAWPGENRVQSDGPVRPSSESMTHAAIYQARSDVGAVFHTHAPLIWRHATALEMHTTPRNIDYGTPEMASLVSAAVRKPSGALAMLGHEDGVVVWGPTIEAAGTATVALFALAQMEAQKSQTPSSEPDGV